MANKKKKEVSVDSDSHYSQDIEEFEEKARWLKEKYYLSNYDLIDILMKQKVEKHLDKIPVSIFNNGKLSALEAIVKYLKEKGVQIRMDSPEKLLHSKYVIVDDTFLIIGSHNWSLGSYFEYDDFSVAIDSPNAVTKMKENFLVMWEEADL